MLSNNAISNRANIIAGFRACGIIPLDPDEFDQQLTEELKRN
jgi:hypothetical protein